MGAFFSIRMDTVVFLVNRLTWGLDDLEQE